MAPTRETIVCEDGCEGEKDVSNTLNDDTDEEYSVTLRLKASCALHTTACTLN